MLINLERGFARDDRNGRSPFFLKMRCCLFLSSLMKKMCLQPLSLAASPPFPLISCPRTPVPWQHCTGQVQRLLLEENVMETRRRKSRFAEGSGLTTIISNGVRSSQEQPSTQREGSFPGHPTPGDRRSEDHQVPCAVAPGQHSDPHLPPLPHLLGPSVSGLHSLPGNH